MATLQEVLELVPALLDDASTSVFTPTFILPYVNKAQRKIVSRFLSNGVRTTRFRQESAMIVPAGTTRLGHDRELVPQAPPNLIAKSTDFSAATGDWTFNFDVPVILAGQDDPIGGVTASRYTFAAATAHDAEVDAAIVSPGTANQFCTGSIWLRTTGVPFTATVSVGFGATGTVSQNCNVTSDWQRVVVSTSATTLAVATAGRLTLTTPVLANLVVFVALPTLTYTQEFLGYSVTTGLPLTNAPAPALPANLIVPDELWEAKLGGGNQDFYRMVGPSPIPNVAPSNTLGYWDLAEDEIRLLGATEDRQVRLEYWGELEGFAFPPIASQAVLIGGGVNAISDLVCGYIATSRGQHELAQTFYAQAELEIDDLVNLQLKTQQQQPQRRMPYRGQGRYDGHFRGYR